MRPATSSAEGSGWVTLQPRSAHSPEPTGSRDSPSLGGSRTSAEGLRSSFSRENQDGGPGPALRTSPLTFQHDRNASDDGAAAKGTNTRKIRFNLKSPISLFARRRSSQNTNKLDDGGMGIGNLHVPAMPDNIETSIYGNIVHDFSKPRNRRSNNEMSPRPAPIPSPSYPRRPSELASPSLQQAHGTPASLHSPMFKEHFHEEQRPVLPNNTAYLHSQSLQIPASDTLPSFAKHLPLNPPSEKGPTSSAPADIPTNEPNSEHWPDNSSFLPPEPNTPPPLPPPPTAAAEEEPPPVLDLLPANALPKHMTSTSSRFSFQIGQQGSIAQEKFLEEKHKEQAAKKPAAVRLSVVSMDDMDDFDYENGMDDDDGFDNGDIVIRNIDMPSSRTPQPLTSAVEHDFDEDEYGGREEEDEFGTGDIVIRNIDVPTSGIRGQELPNLDTHRQALQEFHFTPQSLTFSPSTAQYTSTSTPRDLDGFPIGTAQSKELSVHHSQPHIRNSLNQSPDAMFFDGLGISTLMNDLSPTNGLPKSTEPFDDSDLYFDDGEFDDNIGELDTNFNEDMLDNAEHIKDIPAENARKYEEALHRNLTGDQIKVAPYVEYPEGIPKTPQSGPARTDSPEPDRRGQQTSNQNGLTEGNLAAYHDALALAATQAAANGKFDRAVSFGQHSDDETDSPFHNSVPALSSRDSKYSNIMVESGVSDEGGFGFDDDLDDDEAMIAAANAEALENDDEGFYGQEFGFYARAHGKESAEFSNGGYFASRGSNGVKRSHSGRNNFQEPSLTPITERSEWSTRNSVASLPIHGGVPGGGQALASPSITELLERDSPIVDDEWNINTLIKLRGKTFGGSSTSINSLVERHHPHSSPLAHLSTYNLGVNDNLAARISSPAPGMSSLSIAESEGEDDDWGKPTLTQNTPYKKHVDPAPQSSQEQLPSSPVSRKGNHSRNSSGAESVSYARDTDGRWVLERRRTGDDGELELIEREYLAGTRI